MDSGHTAFRFPASSGQHRFWLLSQLADADGPDPYVVRSAVRISGSIDALLLQRALEAVVEQHDSLRTGLVFDGGRLLQEVHDDVRVVLARCDATGPSGGRRLAAAVTELTRPFQLEEPPLLRATLVALGPALHELHLAVHHAVCDGWSLGVVLDDLVRASLHLRRGEPVPPPAAIQFPDYVVWQQEQLTPRELAAKLVTFCSDLDGLELLPLPVDRSGESSGNAAGAAREQVVGPETWTAVRAVAATYGTTPFTVVVTALGLALARLSGTDDLCLGVAVTGRARKETRRMVGLLMNTLPLRLRFDQLDEEATIGDALAHGAERWARVLAHHDVPYAEIQRAVASPPSTGRTGPLFRVLCLYQDMPMPTSTLDEVGFAPVEVGVRSVRADLALVVSPEENGSCRLALEYATALIDDDTAQCWLDLLLEVVAAIADDVSQPWRGCGTPVDGPDSTAAPSPPGAWDRFLDCARATPNEVAVESWEPGSLPSSPTRTSYAELLEKVTDLRRRLHDSGLSRGHRLGVELPRGRSLVAVLLACLADGLTYVPLDPAVPAARRRRMADAAAVCAVLEPTEEGGPPQLTPVHRCGPHCGSPDLGADGIAYVMFTSGSTGTPKGAALTRGALDAVLDWMIGIAALAPGSTWAALSSIGFDISLVELLCPVLASATTIVVPQHVAVDGPRLDALLRELDVSVVQATPSTWQLLRRAGARLSSSLRILSGGEPLPEGLATWLLGDAPARRVTNLYGPTEATIWVSGAEVVPGRPVTLGDVLPGAGRLVLDPTLRPVPRGAVGELYLSGAPLAHGYLTRPRETAVAFLPQSGHPGARMYRTGDRVRLMPDGGLHYVGRDDDQVKVRGRRVELGEIESVLASHPDVLEAVVVAVRHGEDDLRLVAAVVPRPESREGIEITLRTHLVHQLPATAAPRILVAATLPRTTAGKVDRQALVQEIRDAPAPTSAPPVTALEQSLCCLFEEVLGTPVHSTEAGFFELGGHSLLAATLLRRIEDEFSIAVPLRRLFDAPTVGALASYLAPRLSVTGRSNRDREEIGALEQLDEQTLDRMLDRLAATGEVSRE